MTGSDTVRGRRVVVGVSGSASSLAALYRAVGEAARRDAVLVPVAAWQRADEVLRPFDEPEYQARRRLDRVFEQAFGGYPAGVLIHPEVVRAQAAQALVAAADRPTDLLVVGSGRPGRLHRHFGQVARYCRAHAGCEVLVVPPSELLETLRPGALPLRAFGERVPGIRSRA
ncbi:universal stress protein [Kitasatospora mediocidica]|uniref:universal stress protein n=1 Tax=Kitasatospora mediocidica TaxID=58352 RepID=UPI0007C8366F|nr:universal stress protein [Kitasatospora mediocidica]